MAAIRALFIVYQRAAWRAFLQRGGPGETANTLLMAGLVLILIPDHFDLMKQAQAAFAVGNVQPAGDLLLRIVLYWLALPMILIRGREMNAEHLSLFPLTFGQKMVLEILVLVGHPFGLVALFLSVLSLIPLMARGVHGVTCSILFLFVAILATLAVRNLGQSLARLLWATRAGFLFLVPVPALFYGFWPRLSSALHGLPEHLPIQLALRGTSGSTGAMLLLMLWSGIALLAAWSGLRLKHHLALGGSTHSPGTVRDRDFLRFAKVPLGVWFHKELKYTLLGLEPYFGFVLIAGCVNYLISDVRPQPEAVLTAVAMVCAINSLGAFNLFGPDGTAVDRYRLLPVPGLTVMRLKNLALCSVILLSLAPLIAATAVVFGPLTALIACLEVGTTVAITLIFGNYFSLESPFHKSFFSIHIRIATLIFSFVPAIVSMILGITLMREDPLRAILVQIIILMVALFLYLWRIKASGQRFDQRPHYLRSLLTE